MTVIRSAIQEKTATAHVISVALDPDQILKPARGTACASGVLLSPEASHAHENHFSSFGN
jgi:hypothetical protein